MVAYACGVLVMQGARARRPLRDVLRLPGTSSCACCVVVFLTGAVTLGLQAVSYNVVSHSIRFEWTAAVNSLEFTVGKAIVALWTVLLLSGCMRFEAPGSRSSVWSSEQYG